MSDAATSSSTLSSTASSTQGVLLPLFGGDGLPNRERACAVVTGASQGIGRAVCVALAPQVARLVLVARGIEGLEMLAAGLREAHKGLVVDVVGADLSTEEGVVAVARVALDVKRGPTPTLLVNNAGRYEPGALATEREGLLNELWATNVLSAYNLTRALLPAMLGADGFAGPWGGHVVNVCSTASIMGYPNGGSYAITKHALLGFGRTLRQELGSQGIKVTSVLPGATFTRSWEGSGMDEVRLMPAEDVAQQIVAVWRTSARTCIEEVLLRPMLGDL